METFFSFLSRRIDDCSSLLCVGLDPHPSELTSHSAEGAQEFCQRIISSTAPYAAAFKPNAAFFEALGAEGWTALRNVIAAVQVESNRLGSRIPVILDAKRGDIASTAAAYARSAFELLGVDAITLSPFLGRDSIEPFLDYQEKGVFLLCKTSNPGAADVQDMWVMPDRERQLPGSADSSSCEPLYVHIARLARTWNARDNVGLVVGATQVDALQRVRQAAGDLWILSPGVGEQGGDLAAALAAGLRKDGKGMLVHVSRGISKAKDPAAAAASLRDEMINILYGMNKNRK